MAAADSRLDLAERERLRHERSESGLDRHLARLPEGHPSSLRYADSTVGDNEPDRDEGQPERIRPLTDAEYAEHIKDVEAKLEAARAAGLSTDIRHTIDSGREVWTDERRGLHDDILHRLYAEAAAVPRERKAVVAGGLPGAGKTTVLTTHTDLDSAKYLMINPDLIKEEMARRGLIPEIDGLSPMEASDLVHEESSYLARRLGNMALAEGRNLIWDITMSSSASIEKRIAVLRSEGYSQVEGLFVDIPIDVSTQRAAGRHREGHERHMSGSGFGGRYVPPELILDQADEDWGSRNRMNFEQAKGLFDGWFLYDNSVDARVPRLVECDRLGDDRDRRTVL